MNRLLPLLLLACTAAEPSAPDDTTDDTEAPAADPILAIDAVFLGNSYTSRNDLTGTYERLASGLDPLPSVAILQITSGGRRLAEHAADPQVLDALASPRTHVIVQEQSQIPGFDDGQPDKESSKAAAAELATAIEASGARMILFQTWGRQAGDEQNPDVYPDYTTMQDRLTAGYAALAAAASAADVTIAPVGEAFRAVHNSDPALFAALYDADGSHPSPIGTYLAATVIGATVHNLPADAFTVVPPAVDPDDAVALRAAAQAALDAL